MGIIHRFTTETFVSNKIENELNKLNLDNNEKPTCDSNAEPYHK